MSYEAYNKFATAFKNEIQEFDYEQQLEILTIVVSAMNQKQKKRPSMSKEETMRLFEKFTGSLKVPENFDAKKEYLEYLDERYGV